jgi:hypothetical protein
MDIPSPPLQGSRSLKQQVVSSMGDKSPKAKDKSKKQVSAGKDQKKAAAFAKANPPSPGSGKKGK